MRYRVTEGAVLSLDGQRVVGPTTIEVAETYPDVAFLIGLGALVLDETEPATAQEGDPDGGA